MSKKEAVGTLFKRDNKTIIPRPTSFENEMFKDPGPATGSAGEVQSKVGFKERSFFPGNCDEAKRVLIRHNEQLRRDGKLCKQDFFNPLYGIREGSDVN